METASVASLTFAKSYWVTMRPYLLFVSGITGLAGLSFAPVLSMSETVALFLVYFLSYGFGQALTDCFQTDTDAISSPYRPLVRGIIAKADVLAISLVNLLLCGVVLGYFALSSLGLAVLCVAGLATYTYFKRRWWGGPFYNGWIVAVLFLIGYNSGLRGVRMEFTDNISFALAAVLFGYANFVLVGYFKDISADRATGYNTLPVVFGREFSAVVSDIFAIIFCVTGTASFVMSVHAAGPVQLAIAWILLAASWYASLITQARVHATTTDDDAHRAIAPSVHTYILMFCAIASANRPAWAAAMLVFYAAFVITLSVRPERSQI